MIDELAIIAPAFGGTAEGSPSDYRVALAQGAAAIGVRAHRVMMVHSRFKHAACWGWRQGTKLRQAGKEVLVMERGYVGDRFKYTSLGWNGLNNHATFPEYPDDGGARFRAHGGEIKPWRKGGDYVLILGQVRGDMSLQGQDLTHWYQQQAHAARVRYGKRVYFRPHPLGRTKGFCNIPGIVELPGTLEEGLAGALFTVAYNSNSCLDSVLAGVPCFAGDRGTMAWDVCMRSILSLEYPDREALVHRLAWCQWEKAEIESGEALRRLLDV